MTAQIKIISELEKVAKNGNKYKLVYVEIEISGTKLVRRIAIF